MVAPEITAFPFNATLLVTFTRRTELGGEPPVRAECHEPHRLIPPIATQDLAHRTRQIVVPQQVENAAEVGESLLVRFKERLLRVACRWARWKAGPLAIERIANTWTLVRSSPRSTQASCQSTQAS
jgi:hypothetical protein